MPRFFISTPDCPASEEGVELAGAEGLRDLMRKALADILQDEGERTGIDAIEAEARDEEGRLLMRARVSFSVDEVTEKP